MMEKMSIVKYDLEKNINTQLALILVTIQTTALEILPKNIII